MGSLLFLVVKLGVCAPLPKSTTACTVQRKAITGVRFFDGEKHLLITDNKIASIRMFTNVHKL